MKHGDKYFLIRIPKWIEKKILNEKKRTTKSFTLIVVEALIARYSKS